VTVQSTAFQRIGVGALGCVSPHPLSIVDRRPTMDDSIANIVAAAPDNPATIPVVKPPAVSDVDAKRMQPH
jgi:hypothetical protein